MVDLEHHQGMYVPRNASGLRRELNTWDVFVINVLGYSLGLVLLATPGFIAAQGLAVRVWILVAVGFAASVANGVLLARVSGRVARSGGEYVFARQALGLRLGFLGSWWLTVSQIFGLGAYAVWAVQQALVPSLVGLALNSGNNNLASRLAIELGRPAYVTLLAIGLLVLAAALSWVSRRFLKIILSLLLLTALGSLSVVLLRLGATDTATVIRGGMDVATRMGAEAEAWQRIGASVGDVQLRAAGILDYLPLGYWMFLGFTYSTYLSGEVKRAGRSQMVGVLSSVAFGAIFYLWGLSTFYKVVPLEVAKGLTGLPSSAAPLGTSMLGLAIPLLPSSGWLLVVVAGMIAWYIAILAVILQVCVRNVFAWSLDGLIGEWWRSVGGGGAVPRNAILGCVGLAIPCAVAVAWSWVAFVNYLALFGLAYIVAGLGCVYGAWRVIRRHAGLPAAVLAAMEKRPGAMLALGLANVTIFTLLVWKSLSSSTFAGATSDWRSYALLGGASLLGVAVAERGARKVHRDTVFVTALPPE